MGSLCGPLLTTHAQLYMLPKVNKKWPRSCQGDVLTMSPLSEVADGIWNAGRSGLGCNHRGCVTY